MRSMSVGKTQNCVKLVSSQHLRPKGNAENIKYNIKNTPWFFIDHSDFPKVFEPVW